MLISGKMEVKEEQKQITTQARKGEQEIKLRETWWNMKSSISLQKVNENYDCEVNVKDMNQQFTHSYMIDGP